MRLTSPSGQTLGNPRYLDWCILSRLIVSLNTLADDGPSTRGHCQLKNDNQRGNVTHDLDKHWFMIKCNPFRIIIPKHILGYGFEAM